jgi:hypothetical protein
VVTPKGQEIHVCAFDTSVCVGLLAFVASSLGSKLRPVVCAHRPSDWTGCLKVGLKNVRALGFCVVCVGGHDPPQLRH